MRYIALAICLALQLPALFAASMPTGTWTRRANKEGVVATVMVEAAGSGRKITFKVLIHGGTTSTMVVTTQGDGKDATVYVDGKPSGETMAIRFIDDHHTTNIIKMNGNTIAEQDSEFSADGKVITVRNKPGSPGAANPIEYWDKK